MKMYVVSRRDLPPGAQAVQAMHAALDFSVRYPEETSRWNSESNYLIFLSVENESQLRDLIDRVEQMYLPYVDFREPDFDDSLTAVALAPSETAAALCMSLPLALQEGAMT